MKRLKYGNVKCEWHGEKFDSKRELERHLVLLDMQKRREIFKLERQPKFHLVVNGWSICTYIADWRYRDDGGQSIVEDCKGFATREWKIKWALAKALNPSSEFITS